MIRTQKRKLTSKLGAVLLRAARGWLERKSPARAEQAGAAIGRMIWRFASKRRSRCLSNLALAFPDMDNTARRELCKKVFEHYGIVTADFLRGRLRSPDEVVKTMHIEGSEIFDEVLAKGKGALMITGHFGNWERLSAWVAGKGYTVSVVARDTADGDLNNFLAEMRSTTGTKVIARGNAVRPIIESLRRNEMVGILPDQNSDEVFIPFFGVPAGTVLGPGVLADRTGAPVLCCYCVRIGPNKYKMWAESPLTPHHGEVKGEGMMRAIHESLERVIREYPEQWLWFHDRWRSARKAGLAPEVPP